MILVPEAGQPGDRVALEQHNKKNRTMVPPGSPSFLLGDFSHRGLI
jgi:hypothetical protein